MTPIRRISFVAGLAGLLVLVALSSLAKESSRPSGRQLYLENCARCHGVDRRGDGPDAPFFLPQPRDLTGDFLNRYAPEELVARVRKGTPLALRADPEGRAVRAARVETIVAHMQRLPDVDWKVVDMGGMLYGQRCEVCHGAFGQPWPVDQLPPGVQAPPQDLRDASFQKDRTDAELKKAVRHGVGAMPSTPPVLTDEEADQIVGFVRLLSPGFEAYSFYCAGCHGDDGRGRGILLDPDDRVSVVFDRTYLEETDPEKLRTSVWHMMDQAGGGMPHLQHSLDQDSAMRIVQYLRGQAPAAD